jgi:hypothetical protein
MEALGQRQPAPLDRARERRHSPCPGRRGQRALGSLGQGAEQARLENSCRHDARRGCADDRLSIHHRRPDARGGIGDSEEIRAWQGEADTGSIGERGCAGLHDKCRMAGLRYGEDEAPPTGDNGSRISTLQDEGRYEHRGRSPAAVDGSQRPRL